MKAIVLSGGGSKGSYQIGVWKALKKLNIKYDIITGTSVGALNGALMVENNYHKALKIWNKINLKVLFGEDATKDSNNLEVYKMYGKHFLKNGGMNVNKLENLLNKNLNKKKFYNSKTKYGLVTYNLTTKQPLELTKENIDKNLLTDYLMASATCFPAFQKKDIEGHEYIDGGYFDNLPINLAIDMGASEIIAIDLNAPGIKQTPNKKVKIITISPKNKLTNFLNFNEIGSKRNIKFGYNDTMKVFEKLEGNKYTFKKNHINKNRIKHQDTYLHIINKILKYKNSIKAFQEIINIDFNSKDEMINKMVLKVMESLGKSFEIDETKIYSYKSFNKELKKKLNNYLKEEIKTQQECKQKEIKIYKEIQNQNFKELRKKALINPIEILKAIYLYTICEA